MNSYIRQSSTGLSATYNYDSDGNLLGLIAGSSISDTWTYNADEQVQTTSLDGVTSAPVTYNANRQITGAANLATSTSDDQYSVAANGEILSDQAPSGTTTHFSYNSGDELCNVSTTTVACGSIPTSGSTYTYNVDGERASSTVDSAGTGVATTDFSWNNYGELCGVGPSSIPCGSTPTGGTSYSYNGNGLRMSATTAQAITESTWDTVTDGTLPLNINDATVSVASPGATTNTSYIYGDPLFGGTAPVEQISGSTATFLVVNPTGVQGVYGSTGTTLELAVYSPYGTQTVATGTDVTPFGFQGSYADSTGLIYLIDRYYDPTTDSFISVDPDVQQTDQPYVFTDDDPLNATDPLGLCSSFPSGNCTTSRVVKNEIGAIEKDMTAVLKAADKQLTSYAYELQSLIPGMANLSSLGKQITGYVGKISGEVAGYSSTLASLANLAYKGYGVYASNKATQGIAQKLYDAQSASDAASTTEEFDQAQKVVQNLQEALQESSADTVASISDLLEQAAENIFTHP